MRSLVAELCATFAEAFGDDGAPQFAVAPGRANLIGEHTDYNDGFVLPMAIDRYVGVAFSPRDDGCVCAYSPAFRERHRLEIGELSPGKPNGWGGYVAGVIWAIRRAGMQPQGMNIVMQGQIPMGAGLSSSAALEMAVARAVCEVSGLPWEPVRMAELGRQAEREYVGVSCGIMDQFASAMSVPGCALLLDCRSLATERVPLPAGVSVVVMDTGVRRSLASSAYNERYDRCQEALGIIRSQYPEVQALRDVTPELLSEFGSRMDPVTFRRASHVVAENARPAQMAEALATGHLLRAGRLMNDSHRSLRDLYEVSCPELDWMVSLAEQHPACFGARLTGAGFGGCAVALVQYSRATEFMETVTAGYQSHFDLPADLFICEPSPGVRIVDDRAPDRRTPRPPGAARDGASQQIVRH